jgi:4,5-DOPA dioxygenase extradiol
MPDERAATRLPVLFLGHGTPLNAVRDNAFTRGWSALGRQLPRPQSILAISAHWYTMGTGVTAMDRPRTIYDFGYRNLGHLKYPAPGDPALAERVAQLLAPRPVVRDQSWGLDHGSWSVLLFLFPKADIPVVQLSIDGSEPPSTLFDLAKRLSPLREEGVLIMATGNVVHNLEHYIRSGDGAPYPWAERFDALVRDKLNARDWEALADYESLGDDAALAVPTPDHYLPLVYAMGASDPAEPVSFRNEAIEGGSMSMRTVVFGGGVR